MPCFLAQLAIFSLSLNEEWLKTININLLKVDDTLQLNFSGQVRRTQSIQREEQLDLTWEVYAPETKIKWRRLSRWTLRNARWSIIVSYVTQKGICKLLTWHLSLLCWHVSMTLTFLTMHSSLETLYPIDFHQPPRWR